MGIRRNFPSMCEFGCNADPDVLSLHKPTTWFVTIIRHAHQLVCPAVWSGKGRAARETVDNRLNDVKLTLHVAVISVTEK